MPTGLAVLLVAAVAGALTHHVGPSMAARLPLRRRNYRGLEVPSAIGLALVVGAGVALAGLALLDLLWEPLTTARTSHAAAMVLIGTGFGMLGLYDDLIDEPAGSWRDHARAIARLDATGGAVRSAGGVALAILVVAPSTTSFLRVVLHAALIWLTASTVNLFDTRPGRAGKVALAGIAGVALAALFVATAALPATIALLAAVATVLPLDLRERAMLGNAGAASIGAMLGMLVTIVAAERVAIVIVALLVLLHVLADGAKLHRAIGRIEVLRTFDSLGRVPEITFTDPGEGTGAVLD